MVPKLKRSHSPEQTNWWFYHSANPAGRLWLNGLYCSSWVPYECCLTHRRRAAWRWWRAGTRRGPGCSSSWSWKWGACCGHMVYVTAETRWVARWPEREMPECPWWGWPKASGRPSKESPARGGELRSLIYRKEISTTDNVSILFLFCCLQTVSLPCLLAVACFECYRFGIWLSESGQTISR